jgi:NAD(P)-dependent dehydrogenase (short-subunit alcohol dehydrogenase family)
MLRFEDRVAIVTGAGGGLGRTHALALAARGARVVVTDVAGAEAVADEIRAAGGEALAGTASVSDRDAIAGLVERVMATYGRVDILVNNAGIIRDKSFAKLEYDDFIAVMDVHVTGAFVCTKAVWDIMRRQNYGRIVMTTSSSGLYGNFGQANYSAAKMALVGLANTLALEGAKYDVRVNALAPTAQTRMTDGLLPPAAAEILKPETIAAGVLFLASEDAPTHTVLCAGGGSFERAYVTLTEGVWLAEAERTPEGVAAAYERISARANERVPVAGWEQSALEVEKAQRGAATAVPAGGCDILDK